jgi:hypothetical protein
MKIKPIKSLTDKIKFGQKYKAPTPNDENLPPIYNIMMVAGPKGSGKGVIINHYLQLCEKSGYKTHDNKPVRQRIIWLSGGTSNSKQNAILDELKNLHKDDRIDLDLDGDVNAELDVIYQDILQERDEIEAYNIYRKVFDKYMKSKSLNNLTLDELMLLRFKDFIDPKDDPDAPRDNDDNLLYHPRVVHMVVDDLIQTDVFSNNKRGNFFNKISIKSRHDSPDLCPINIIYITQNFKAVPSVIRKQVDIFILLKNANREAIIESLSNEISSHFSKEELTGYYDEVMKIPYASLILSIHKSEKDTHRVRVGWTNLVERDPKYTPELQNNKELKK